MSLSVNLPSFTIGPDAYDEIGKYAGFAGNTVAIIGGETALAKSLDRLKPAIEKAGLTITTIEWYGGEASYGNIDRLVALEDVAKADMIFAVGGGRAIDTGKTVADNLSKPVFTFPTIASNCAPTSAVCILYYDNHESAGSYRIDAPAVHAFADTTIIAEAPEQYIWAGIGDALSKEVEASFSAQGRDLAYKNAMGVHIVQGTNERLMANGVEALAAAKKHELSPAIDNVILEILGTTSYTSVLVDHAYNGHFAHSFYYGVTVLPQGEKHLHGEIVSYGVLVVLQLAGETERLTRLRNFMIEVGLPTSLAALDITTEEDLALVLDKAMTTDHVDVSPFPIDRPMIEDAIKAVEALND
ncbi:iron-containing alcohol dehydrogenase family protein [Aerococcus agrisoli]|uniref:Glycerol dehydrogenase n=1 Tax=Aerococcus agrisoli TaxID=2487350 RepID=A0A3N4G0B4_9LACT|nr:iron-containing alcohol dehydrogenase family protein [Aerococcus agrisoli]RPA55905.1 iron-containing alcohol dehydrogenase family protein [Aerococcus agrisoli]